MAHDIRRPPYTPISLYDLRTRIYGETQKDFAMRIGVSQATLASWERAKKPRTPRFSTRHQIAERLGLDYGDIAWEAKYSALAA